MRAKYSIGAAILALASAAAAGPCPPAIARAAREVAALRQVPPPFSPPCRQISLDTLERELQRKLRRDLPVPLEVFVEALSRLGLVEGDPATLIPRVLAFYRSQVLGFYEPEHDEMVIVGTPAGGDELAALVWAHELEHAAQEHRFRLPSRILGLGHNGDAQRAAAAIAEGDALLVMFLLAMPTLPGADTLALAEAALSGQVTAQLANANVPAYFVEDLLFPYTTGFSAVLGAYRQGGWEAVDRLLADPPGSTAALLHPDRPPPSPLDNSVLPSPPAGYEVVLTDTMGEWGVSVWLTRRLQRETAQRLAAGWAGDRLLLARSRRNPERWALAWELACRDVPACDALQAAFQQHTPALLARLAPGRELLLWHRSGTRLGLRAGWPAALPDGTPQGLAAGRGSTTEALVMTTVSRGTSLGNGPPAPVGTAAIASTTSIPETTRPNTQ